MEWRREEERRRGGGGGEEEQGLCKANAVNEEEEDR